MTMIYNVAVGAAAERTGQLPMFDWDSLPRSSEMETHSSQAPRGGSPFFRRRRARHVDTRALWARRALFTLVFLLFLGNLCVGAILAVQGITTVQAVGVACLVASSVTVTLAVMLTTED